MKEEQDIFRKNTINISVQLKVIVFLSFTVELEREIFFNLFLQNIYFSFQTQSSVFTNFIYFKQFIVLKSKLYIFFIFIVIFIKVMK